MEKIFALFEKFATWGASQKETDLLDKLQKAVTRLDLDILASSIDSDQLDEDGVKLSITDSMFYLILIASKRGMCLDCLFDNMDTKLKWDMDHTSENILVMQPTIVIKNNMGPSEFNSEQSQIIPKMDPYEASKVKCDLCGRTWIAVRPEGLERLECPTCHNMVTFDNLSI
jgi:hypothetical protein